MNIETLSKEMAANALRTLNYVAGIGVDGIENHPNADPGCPICDGGGLLDDGNNFASWLVPCICTGRCPIDVVAKLEENRPKEVEAYKELCRKSV